MPIDAEDIAEVSFSVREPIRRHGTYDIVVSDRTIDDDRVSGLGTCVGIESCRVGTVYPIRDDTGEIYRAVYALEGDWTSDAVESMLPELADAIPYLTDVPVTVYGGDSRARYRVGARTVEPIDPERPHLNTYRDGEMYEIAISVNRSTSLEHYIHRVTADTTIETVQEQLDADGIDPVVLRRRSAGEYEVVEPENTAQLGDLFTPEEDRQMLVFHPGGYQEIVGSPFGAHPAFQPLDRQ